MLNMYITLILDKRRWRRLNPHNFTTYSHIYGNMKKVHIGNYTYGEVYVSAPNENCELYVGNFCSIAGGVKFILGADHSLHKTSTYPFKNRIMGTGIDATTRGDIRVGDDVWIGENAIILSGVTIGQGAVIGAGAVVTKDIPPYAIAVGVPAKVKKYRFAKELIQRLENIDYSRISKKDIIEHANELTKDLKNEKQLDWMPKKNLSTTEIICYSKAKP